MSPSPAKLTRRERQIMDVLYQRGHATVSEVLDGIPDPPSYSAVRATLGVLESKGHVRHKQEGPRYVYLPAVPTEKARRAALEHVLNTFFEGSAEQAVVALLQMSETELAGDVVDRLTERIEQAKREGR